MLKFVVEIDEKEKDAALWIEHIGILTHLSYDTYELTKPFYNSLNFQKTIIFDGQVYISCDEVKVKT